MRSRGGSLNKNRKLNLKKKKKIKASFRLNYG
jgi:hypothetical protein